MAYAPYDPAGTSLDPVRQDLIRTLLQEPDGIPPADFALLAFLHGDTNVSIESLRRTCSLSPAVQGQCLSDLSVLYLARSKEGDLMRALDASSHALELGARTSEALFNQALCLQKLSLSRTARTAWLRYLGIDAGSTWSDDARDYLKRLGKAERDMDSPKAWSDLTRARGQQRATVLRPLVSRDVQAARMYGEEQLLGEWGAAWLQNKRRDSEDLLDVAREIGKDLSLKQGDRMLANAVAAIDRASRSGDMKTLDRLARGHLLYQEGIRDLDGLSYEKARARFLESFRLLSSAGSAFSSWPRLRIAICAMQQFRYDDALPALMALAFEDAQRDKPALRGVAFWAIGLIHGIQARPAEAAEAYQKGKALFTALGEMGNLAVVESLLATSFRDLGDLPLAWQHEWKALRLLPYVHEPRKRFLILDEAQILLQKNGNLAAALAFQEEIIAESTDAGQPVLVVTSLRKKALLCSELGWRRKAFESIQEAKRRLQDVPNAESRRALANDILMTEGRIVAVSDPKEAVKLLSPALRFYDQTYDAYQRADLLYQRAQAHWKTGDLELVERDLGDAICLLERQARDIPEASLQEQFWGRARDLFELMVELQLRLGRSEKGLGYAEQVRTNPLLIARLGRCPPASDVVAAMQSALSAREALVEFAVVRDGVHVWLVRRSSVQHVSLPLTGKKVEDEVQALSDSMAKDNDSGFHSSMQTLGRELLEEILPRIGRGERIIFVPDGPLNLVPFAALCDPRSGRHLIQDFPVTTAPSGMIYAAAVARAENIGPRFDSVLALGDPHLDRRLWPSLKALSGARKEVSEVAAVYPRTRTKVLIGESATVSELLQEGKHYRVLHLASHAIVNPEQPLLSMLLLSREAMEGGGNGILYARDLYSVSLPETRIIVLAACNSLGGRAAGREGLSSLARPFLAAGVPSVVGSIWPVDDEEAREFLVQFHANLLKLREPVRALQQTQIDSLTGRLRRPVSPRTWAGFEIAGL